MKRIHPKLISTAALSALALLGNVGCKNPSGAVGNPFLAPNRVPPPATRALLPGEAQPYYPGDPLPVMQSQSAAPNSEVQLAAAEPQMPSATEILKWSSPKGAEQATAAVPTTAPAPQALAANPAPTVAPASAPVEPSIAVPADGGDLRFAQTEPIEPQPLTPPAASPIATPPAQNQFAAAPTPQAVIPVSYTEPTLAAPEPAAPNPWRTPQPIAQQPAPQSVTFPPPPPAPTAAPPVATPAAPAPWPMTAPPLFAATNTMDVRMRAVPSPPVDYYSPTPRIRMPGYEQTTYVGTNDGFRPRSSMR